jgi:hypothetical protein
MDITKKFKKVYLEVYTADGYQSRWIYKKRHRSWTVQDVPKIVKSFMSWEHTELTGYRYAVDQGRLYLGLFYGIEPPDEANRGKSGPVQDEIE